VQNVDFSAEIPSKIWRQIILSFDYVSKSGAFAATAEAKFQQMRFLNKKVVSYYRCAVPQYVY
jgi:hypothetical protein